ncbi:MAG TPA: hypothetical protein VHO70_24660 [Chitinispirillaceae bacterium]|nr:hypothetical protein [Chitinispirillaceae bacterium]
MNVRRASMIVQLLFTLSVMGLNAETISLSGKVVNATGKAISGANVQLSKLSQLKVVTDTSGQFNLKGEITAVCPARIDGFVPDASLLGANLHVFIRNRSSVKVTIHTVSGKQVYSNSTGFLSPGMNNIVLPMKSLSAGVYFISAVYEGNRSLFKYNVSGSRNIGAETINQIGNVLEAQAILDTLLFSADGYVDTSYILTSYSKSEIQITMQRASRLANITKKCNGLKPSPISGGQSGWGSRYWDCCKPHCSWPEQTKRYAANCDKDGKEIPCFKTVTNGTWTGVQGTKSGCDQDGEAYMCYSHVPYALCDELALGFAAVPANTDICGKCYQIDFDGGFKHGTPKEAHLLMKGKSMIVMASNIGHDVGGGQFDMMIPGGGLGAFKSGCQKQWGVDVNSEALVGKTYGGFTSSCQEKLGWDAGADEVKSCVRSMCDNLFGKDPKLRDLYDGCIWYVDWMNAVDNPTFTYKEVQCPQALIDLYYSAFHPRP